jgi:hypothetical protein
MHHEDPLLLDNHIAWFWLKTRNSLSVLHVALRRLADAIDTSWLHLPQHIESTEIPISRKMTISLAMVLFTGLSNW